jgi:HTH-type transcriptional repressor of NAD biosynthesis genes
VTTGLVIGKFWPLTRGHQYLIETALRGCDRLVIAVSDSPRETIPVAVRKGWLNELYPAAEVAVMPRSLPDYPSDVGNDLDLFYGLWCPALKDACGGVPDLIFSSESYGDEVARYMPPCRHVLVDLERKAVPISATLVRSCPFDHWDYLDPVVRAYFVKTACVYGAESTGKSTLCARLAEHFHTVWQPEWARAYLDECGRHCVYEDMEVIARRHFAAREAYKRRANKVLIVDTDTLTTRAYSEQYYGKYPPVIDELVARPENRNDLYLFTDIDVPWVAEPGRDFGAPALRRQMDERFRRLLESHNIPYVRITGDWEARFEKAVGAIEQHIFGESGGQKL